VSAREEYPPSGYAGQAESETDPRRENTGLKTYPPRLKNDR
jgi:hypothetical protein